MANETRKYPGPRYYFLNGAAWRWSQRTGRPLMEWMWNDDAETRNQDELMPARGRAIITDPETAGPQSPELES